MVRISIKELLDIRKEFQELYEFKKNGIGSNTFTEDHVKTMKNIRGAVREIDQQLESIEVEFDTGKMYLSCFDLKGDE
jgi:hypothetical protein